MPDLVVFYFAVLGTVFLGVYLVILVGLLLRWIWGGLRKLKLFRRRAPIPEKDLNVRIGRHGDYGDLSFERLPDIQLSRGDWRWPGTYPYAQYRYWCRKCGTVLTAGPRGGAAVNAVCETCRVNYGCLPYFEHE